MHIRITESLAVQQKLNNTKNQLYLDKINFKNNKFKTAKAKVTATVSMLFC